MGAMDVTEGSEGRFLRKVYIEKSVANTETTRTVLARLHPDVPIEWVEDGRAVLARHKGGPAPLGDSKRSLLLSDFRGEPIKPCPGTREYLCCQYEILNFGAGCPLDCTYCILQDYFSNPLLVVQANEAAFLAAAGAVLRKNSGRFYRLGTGEFADSLALERLTGYAPRLVQWIRDYPNAILELKSKAIWVDDIIGLDHAGRTVCAWSMNSPEIAQREEKGAAPLSARLDAAKRCQQAGYALAFHFDPLLHYPGWEAGYADTVQRIFERVQGEAIRWISLGCFRFTPGLEQTIRARFPENTLTLGEFIPGGDGKMRYPQPLRIAIYRKMREWIRHYGGAGPLLYFCMENRAVWQAVMDRCPRDNEELGRWLDETCRH